MTTPKPYPEQETTPATQSDKVAEAVSPYIAHTEMGHGVTPTKVKPPVIAGLPASEEVWRFAQENALVPHVETAVRLAHEHFKIIRDIRLDYMVDPEIPNRADLVINLYVTGTFDELIQADNNYIRAINTFIPDQANDKMCPLLWAEAIDLKENSI
jgi:hypothetical protein